MIGDYIHTEKKEVRGNTTINSEKTLAKKKVNPTTIF